jgi:hypothetical protein
MLELSLHRGLVGRPCLEYLSEFDVPVAGDRNLPRDARRARVVEGQPDRAVRELPIDATSVAAAIPGLRASSAAARRVCVSIFGSQNSATFRFVALPGLKERQVSRGSMKFDGAG